MGDMNLIQSFIEDYKSNSETITVRTSGSTGESKVFDVEKYRLKNSALRTLKYFNLRSGDKVLMCMSPLYIAGKMMLVRALEGGLELLLGPVTAQPLKEINKVIDFVAMVPLQFKASSIEDLNQCKQILLGGAPVDQECLHKVKQLSNSVVFESFGMTETLSHFAIKNLSRGDLQFTCLEGVSIRTNNNSCLEVFMEGKKYLVTGAAGFIASQVSKQLLDQGEGVVGVDNLNDYYDVRLKNWRLEQLKAHPHAENFSFACIDIEDQAKLSDLFQAEGPFDAVLNLAARAGVRFSMENPHVYLSTNTEGTLNLLECIRTHECKKLVFNYAMIILSISVAGNLGGGLIFRGFFWKIIIQTKK